MSRLLDDWITEYLIYTEKTESPTIFHKWTAISVIASALRRKTWFNFGRIRVHPNCYIVFVAEPGIARKTQAISYGEEILASISGISMAADVTTIQALLDDLEEAVTSHLMANGEQFSHASLTVCSGEFESFLGSKVDNARMLVILTDLFDCKNKPFKTRTRHSGSNEIPSPYLNLLAATTPESLSNSFPSSAIGGGLTSRIIFVWSKGKSKKVDIPEKPPKEVKERLVQDLAVISRISGAYNFSPSGRDWWGKFYQAFDEADPKRICKDPAFKGWYSRKPLYLLKLATILTASSRNTMLIEPDKLNLAIEYLEEAERTMIKTFSAVGRSPITADVEMVRNIITTYKCIGENNLLQMVWRDIDSKKFDIVISTILRSGEVKRLYQGPNGEKGIFYTWIDKK